MRKLGALTEKCHFRLRRSISICGTDGIYHISAVKHKIIINVIKNAEMRTRRGVRGFVAGSVQ